MLTKIKDTLFDNPYLFRITRTILEAGNTKQLTLLRQHIKPTEKVLDIGCGTGDFSVISESYQGIDLTPSFIAYARKTYDKKFDVMDATHLSFQDKSFTTTMLLSMLHHFPDHLITKVLAEAARVSTKLIVVDLIQKKNPLSKLLYKLDRGKNIRTLEEQQKLISQSFIITHASVFNASLLYSHSFIIAIPK